jgi:hypothetical protein
MPTARRFFVGVSWSGSLESRTRPARARRTGTQASWFCIDPGMSQTASKRRSRYVHAKFNRERSQEGRGWDARAAPRREWRFGRRFECEGAESSEPRKVSLLESMRLGRVICKRRSQWGASRELRWRAPTCGSCDRPDRPRGTRSCRHARKYVDARRLTSPRSLKKRG